MLIRHVLLLDQDAQRRESIARILESLSLDVRQVDHADAALTELNNAPCDWFILSDETDRDSCADLLDCAARGRYGQQPSTLMLAGAKSPDDPTMLTGADDYLESSATKAGSWMRAMKKAERTLLHTRRTRLAQGGTAGPEEPTRTSPALAALLESARRLARSQAAVLMEGEPGTGKSTLARYVHQQSDRARGPLFVLDARATDPADMGPRLFGEEIPRLSGHRTCRAGLLEAAHDCGTVLIEDIHLLPAVLQEKLLVYLQRQCFTRVGGKDELNSTARILATSGVSLPECVRDHSFREDLSVTLQALTLSLPPLRERPGDIPVLAEYFLKSAARSQNKRILALAPSSIPLLKNHPWPGNVAELEQTVARAVAVCSPGGQILEPDHLFPAPPAPEAVPGGIQAIPEDLAAIEKLHIFAVLEKCDHNRTHAARRLGISIRTLRNKLREYRLAAEAEREAA